MSCKGHLKCWVNTQPIKRATVRGFTLIELLVVVLIIGILAAVALPQYQKAVEKSHAVQAMTLLKSFYQAYSLYHLANGTRPTSLAQLDIQSPLPGAYSVLTGSQTSTVATSNGDWSLHLYNDVNGLNGMCIVRIAGRYQGGGFCMWHDIPKTYRVEPGQLYCIERKANSVVLIQEVGFYCKKLFNRVGSFSTSNLLAYKF